MMSQLNNDIINNEIPLQSNNNKFLIDSSDYTMNLYQNNPNFDDNPFAEEFDDYQRNLRDYDQMMESHSDYHKRSISTNQKERLSTRIQPQLSHSLNNKHNEESIHIKSNKQSYSESTKHTKQDTSTSPLSNKRTTRRHRHHSKHRHHSSDHKKRKIVNTIPYFQQPQFLPNGLYVNPSPACPVIYHHPKCPALYAFQQMQMHQYSHNMGPTPSPLQQTLENNLPVQNPPFLPQQTPQTQPVHASFSSNYTGNVEEKNNSEGMITIELHERKTKERKKRSKENANTRSLKDNSNNNNENNNENINTNEHNNEYNNNNNKTGRLKRKKQNNTNSPSHRQIDTRTEDNNNNNNNNNTELNNNDNNVNIQNNNKNNANSSENVSVFSSSDYSYTSFSYHP